MKAKTRQGVTDRIRGIVTDHVARLSIPQEVHGVVSSIQTGPSSLTVKFQGTATLIAGIRYPSWYTPTVGDTIIMHKTLTDTRMVDHVKA
jgi:hypothetical protein